ncbi:MAG: hypothetical protein NT013_16770 [Planctomycetia bacterium]|nr:hypothetical protein [Planctomycetia bacterium]
MTTECKGLKMNHRRNGRTRLSICTLLFFAFGCGESGLIPVARTSGVVTYQGKPVEGADVIFVPEGISRTASGRTNASGEFSMTTYNTNDGAIVALNTILVVKEADQASSAPPDMSKIGTDEEGGKKAMAEYQKKMLSTPMNAKAKKESGPALIPRKYSDLKTSGLKLSVVAGEKNHFKIELKD